MDIASFMGKFLVAITMVTDFLPSFIEIIEGLGVHWSVNEDRDDGYFFFAYTTHGFAIS